MKQLNDVTIEDIFDFFDQICKFKSSKHYSKKNLLQFGSKSADLENSLPDKVVKICNNLLLSVDAYVSSRFGPNGQESEFSSDRKIIVDTLTKIVDLYSNCISIKDKQSSNTNEDIEAREGIYVCKEDLETLLTICTKSELSELSKKVGLKNNKP